MRTFKTKAFTRFADKAGISNLALCRGGEGRRTRFGRCRSRRRSDQTAGRAFWPGQSGGFRALIVFRSGTRAIFVHGFAKSEKDNIGKDELVALKKLAAELLGYDDKTLARVVASGMLLEVKCDEKTVS